MYGCVHIEPFNYLSGVTWFINRVGMVTSTCILTKGI
uniref:Uncharacterized protein n=1 Tax=Arundo donax TaxID=35708 RepID=A0A0A9C760_ARUDO